MKRKTKMLSQCCVCKKVKRKEEYKLTHRKHMDDWGHYHDDLKELQREFHLLFSHGYCDECVKILEKEIAMLKKIRFNAFQKETKF